MNGDLVAPDSVPESSTGPITIRAPSSAELRITVLSTGDVIDVDVDDSGKATFELPAGVRSGSALIVTDKFDSENSAIISITPATAS